MFRRAAVLGLTLLALSASLTACAHQEEASPTAHAGPSRAGQAHQRFEFDGAASQASTWAWALTSTPPGSSLTSADLDGADTPWPSFTPDAEGEFILTLMACEAPDLCALDQTRAFVGARGLALMSTHKPKLDGRILKALEDHDPLDFKRDRILKALEDHDPLDFKGRPQWLKNRPPVAIGSAWQGLRSSGRVLLQAGESYDPDGDEIGVQWTFEVIPAGSVLTDEDLDSADSEVSGFVPDVAGIWQLRLTVSDSFRQDYALVTIEAAHDDDPLE